MQNVIPIAEGALKLSPEQRQALMDVARGVIRSILCGLLPQPMPGDAELYQPAGCFVSLHELRTRRLRGCVGRLDSRGPLAPTVAAMARSVLEDPRFLHHPVTFGDLPILDIELSVLSPLRPAQHCLDFELSRDGLYLTHGDRSGCFLPQVARETGWSKEQLLDRLCMEKLALPAGAWRGTEAKLHRFTVIVIGPEPFLR